MRHLGWVNQIEDADFEKTFSLLLKINIPISSFHIPLEIVVYKMGIIKETRTPFFQGEGLRTIEQNRVEDFQGLQVHQFLVQDHLFVNESTVCQRIQNCVT